MTPNRVEQYRRWFEYEKDSHRKVLASLESVPQDQRDSAPFHKALDIMDHIIAARRMWLFRFGAATERPANLFPSGVTLDDLAGNLTTMELGWAHLSRRSDRSRARSRVRVQKPRRRLVPERDRRHLDPALWSLALSSRPDRLARQSRGG